MSRYKVRIVDPSPHVRRSEVHQHIQNVFLVTSLLRPHLRAAGKTLSSKDIEHLAYFFAYTALKYEKPADVLENGLAALRRTNMSDKTYRAWIAYAKHVAR